jgi:hypothetical protein
VGIWASVKIMEMEKYNVRVLLRHILESETTKEAAEQQPSTSKHRLSDTLGPSKSTIHCHVTALGKIYKRCRIVTHELTAYKPSDESNFVVNYFKQSGPTKAMV